MSFEAITEIVKNIKIRSITMYTVWMLVALMAINTVGEIFTATIPLIDKVVGGIILLCIVYLIMKVSKFKLEVTAAHLQEKLKHDKAKHNSLKLERDYKQKKKKMGKAG